MSTSYVVDQAKWAQLTIFNQMGNIYSEVGRSFKTRNQKNTVDHDAAVMRAIDLFDATVQSLIDIKSPKAKEVLRAKEQFLEVAMDSTSTLDSVQSLERYFMQFAIAARLNR